MLCRISRLTAVPPDYVNLGDMKRVQSHPLTARVRGRICHATTPRNALSILADGWIKAETSRDGIHPRFDDAPASACMAIGAVSMFDFDAPDERLFPTVQIHEETYEYLLHWWSFLTRHPISVLFFLDDAVRARFAPDPQIETPRQFIWGTECCHIGDVELAHVSGYVVTADHGEHTTAFGAGDVDGLTEPLRARITRTAPPTPDAHPAHGERLRRIDEILRRSRPPRH